MTIQKPMLTVEQAKALLARMEAAAPPATATKLADISTLLHSLSNDNAYLVSLYGEALSKPSASSAATPAPPLSPTQPSLPPPLDASECDMLLLQLEDSLRPRLVGIQTALEPLLDDAALTALDVQTQAALRQVHAQQRAAKALLDGMAMVVALRQGLIRATPLVFSANMLLREAERHAHELTEPREQTVSVLYPEDELQAVGDYQRVLDILTDLIDNASRYTPRGGEVRLKAESLGTHVLFSVDDNGIGLRPEDEPHIGKPFWRAPDQPLVRESDGAGLRLYLAQRILALQNGELVFSGDPDVGSTFSVMLPAP